MRIYNARASYSWCSSSGVGSVDEMFRLCRCPEMGDDAVAQQIGRGKDLISILSKLLGLIAFKLPFKCFRSVKENMKASDEDRLQDIEVLGQVIIIGVS